MSHVHNMNGKPGCPEEERVRTIIYLPYISPQFLRFYCTSLERHLSSWLVSPKPWIVVCRSSTYPLQLLFQTRFSILFPLHFQCPTQGHDLGKRQEKKGGRNSHYCNLYVRHFTIISHLIPLNGKYCHYFTDEEFEAQKSKPLLI